MGIHEATTREALDTQFLDESLQSSGKARSVRVESKDDVAASERKQVQELTYSLNTDDSISLTFFSPFFYPEELSTARYNYYLVEALARRGHDVTVVCSYPFYPEWKVATNISNPPIPVRTVRGGKSVRYPRSNLLRRLVLEVWYTFHCGRARASTDEMPKRMCLDVYPPNLFAALRPGSSNPGGRIVAIVHDLQGIMMDARPSIARKLAGIVVRKIEKRALRRADSLIFLSRGMLNYAQKRYGVDPDRCHVAYPFITISNGAPIQVPAPLADNRKTLIYSGALGEKQAPDELFELMDAFARIRTDFAVHIFSGGHHFRRLKDRARTEGSLVQFNDLVPPDELTGLLRRSTVQIIPQKLGLSDGAFPSKLPNLIATHTAIFTVTDNGSELAETVHAYSRGLVSDTWDLSSNLRSLEQLADSIVAEPSDNDFADQELRSRFDIDELCRLIEAGFNVDGTVIGKYPNQANKNRHTL